MARFLRDLWNREGPDTPAPSGGVAGFVYQLVTYFWKLATLNVWFLLASVPVVTLPAALTAMNRVCVKLIRDRNVLAWEEFRDEFKASLKKSILLGLIFAVWGFAAYYLLSLGLTNWDNPFGVAFMAAGVVAGAFMLLLAAYAFVLLAALDLPLRHILGNARALLFLGRRWTLGVFAVLLGVGVLLWLFPLVTVIALLAGGIALVQYAICAFVNEPMQTWIIGPYERSVKGADAG